jgi:membrane associated rhomboid family serine protease
MMPLTPWVKRLLIANIAVYAVTQMVRPLYLAGVLFPGEVLSRPWTLLTYMFLHAPGISHILFNMLGLLFFGPRLENRLGGRHFLELYLWSGVGGAVFSILFAPEYPVVGASAAVQGVLMGFALFWPRERILIYFVLPVEAWILVLGYVILSFSYGVGGARDGIAHFAHLGGLVTGFVYLKWIAWRHGAARREFQRKVNELPSRSLSESSALQRWETIDTKHLHELNRHEIEALLRKARALGVRALTQDERAFLDRMATRN